MRVFIAEDERPARDRLVETIARVEPGASIVGMAASVREAAAWIAANAAPDLMFLDVQLSDGLSFELFESGQLLCPAIFATAYDEFVLRAFSANAIDYVLKPVSDEALRRAFSNFHRIRSHFQNEAALNIKAAALALGQRERLIARQGANFISLRFDQIGLFVSVDKTTFAVEMGGARHPVETSLATLDSQLDPKAFFRLSRQVIVAAAAVSSFKPAGRGRLLVELSIPGITTLMVTQERAADFRAWLDS